MEAPTLIKEIPSQGVNERAAYGPFDLNNYIQSADGSDVRFQAEVEGGASLPQGMICTEDGIVTGIPAKDTQGSYLIVIKASNDAGEIEATFLLNIQPTLVDTGAEVLADELKQQVWQALGENMPPPEITELLERAISPYEIYYLLERWGTLTVYDAFNLEPPSEKHLIVLEGASEHFLTYDRGCCLVACPKDLFSHERTLADGLVTAEALAREAFKRDWTVELVGFEKYSRAAWVELQTLGDKHNKKVEVLNYDASPTDVKLCIQRASAVAKKAGMDK